VKVLIIDDDSVSRNLLDAIMKNAGFTTELAADGVAAFEYVNNNGPYDVYLVDWDMPRMDGLEFIKKMQEFNKVGNSRIVMITCHDTMEDAMTATSLGIDSYLVKPIEVDKIYKLLISFGFLEEPEPENAENEDAEPENAENKDEEPEEAENNATEADDVGPDNAVNEDDITEESDKADDAENEEPHPEENLEKDI